jgi:hypothetical protein
MWCGVSAINQKESDMNATAASPVVGVDLSKSVFQLAVADSSWRVVESHRLTRTQFERWFGNRVVGLVVMEACGSAHHWARWLNGLGIAVRLLPAAYIRAYVKRNKTDAADACALLEAARCAEIVRVLPGVRRRHCARQSLWCQWALAVQHRANHNKAACALANKLARICYATLRDGEPYGQPRRLTKKIERTAFALPH